MMIGTGLVRCWMPSIEGFPTLSMMWYRAAITLSQSSNHSNAWVCSGGSWFPTRTPPQPPGAKNVVLLFCHHPLPPSSCSSLPSSRIHRNPPIIRNMQNYLWKQTPTSKRNKQQERKEKWQRNEKTNENLAQKPTLSNLPLKFPPLIFSPGFSRWWSSRLLSVLILPSRVLHAYTFVPGYWEGAHDPVSFESRSWSWFNETVFTPPALSSMPVKSAWPPYLPGVLLAAVYSKCTLVKCTSRTWPPSVLLSSRGEKNEISPPWPFVWSTLCIPVSAQRQEAYALLSRRCWERDCSRICSSHMASSGRAVYFRRGCTSKSTFGDRAKCSTTSCISCVNCSVESSGAEGHVGRAGDGAGETGRAGGDGGDVSDDDGGSSGEFERSCDGDGGGGSEDEGIGLPACA